MKYRINLLTIKKEKPLDRVIYFALNYLRYILVVTQIVVIGVFFYRFKVDQEIVDFKESLSQKKDIVDVSHPLIEEAKAAEFTASQTEQIIRRQNKMLQAVDYILSRFPSQFFLDKLQIDKDIITLTGYTQGSNLMQSFFTRIKKEARFEKIELSSLKKTESGLEFSFVISQFKDNSSL